MTPELSETDFGFTYRYRQPEGDPGTSPGALVLLHGAAGDESSLWSVAEAIGPDVAILSVRGQVDEDGPRFFRRAEEGKPDEDDLRARIADLAKFVTGACEKFDLDPASVWVFGYSNGATATAALALEHPDVLAGGVILAARPPFHHSGRVLDGKAFFCAHARDDEQVSIIDYEDVVELLVTAGAEVELHWYDGGHELTQKQVEEAAAWLQRKMSKKA